MLFNVFAFIVLHVAYQGIVTTLWYLMLFILPKVTLVFQGYDKIIALLHPLELPQDILRIR
jgi:hypothetical protein